MKNIKAIFFDADNTLFDVNTALIFHNDFNNQM